MEVALSRADIGEQARVLAVVRDVSRRKEAEEELEFRTGFELLIAGISTRFVSISIEDVDAEIERALGDVVRFAGINAGYIMRFSDDNRVFGMTHLWTDGTLMTDKNSVQGLPVDAMPYWMGKVFRNEIVSVPSVDALPEEASVEKGIISGQGVRAVIDVPLVYQGKVLGVLGFNSSVDRHNWTSIEVSLLRFVGQIFISALERKAGEEALRLSEAQLLQSQKMEAIGRLAGGVAHDFNNILTGIVGYTEMVLEKLDPKSQEHQDVQEIENAAERAAGLTRQLLAFSRKQANVPQVIQLNEIVEQSRNMLGRIIGEDVRLTFVPGDDLWAAKIDPSQIDQILVNFATNSRDALPEGGSLEISTHNFSHDVDDAAHPELPVGEYVALVVTDDGIGIPEELQPKIFEPFFSTKEPGKGTGLGLSTVYGLVRQNHGYLSVESTPGQGTKFSVLLPRERSDKSSQRADTRTSDVPTGSERILLVEDEELVRNLAKRALTTQGYRVVAAEDGVAAHRAVDAGAVFDLLLTDVVMPGLKGPDLYDGLREQLPELKCLFMSGYAENVIVHHGVTDSGKTLLQKPFTLGSLVSAVRKCLDE